MIVTVHPQCVALWSHETSALDLLATLEPCGNVGPVPCQMQGYYRRCFYIRNWEGQSLSLSCSLCLQQLASGFAKRMPLDVKLLLLKVRKPGVGLAGCGTFEI